MKKLLILAPILMLIQSLTAQQKFHGGGLNTLDTSSHPNPDSTLTLSVQKFDVRVQELQGELEKQVKTKDQAQKVLQQTEDNIKALQSAIQAMLMVKQDTTLHVPTKSKK